MLPQLIETHSTLATQVANWQQYSERIKYLMFLV